MRRSCRDLGEVYRAVTAQADRVKELQFFKAAIPAPMNLRSCDSGRSDGSLSTGKRKEESRKQSERRLNISVGHVQLSRHPRAGKKTFGSCMDSRTRGGGARLALAASRYMFSR
eukprot:scaffold3622_cov250-Pinguiococcus_pyrenoidosus.AAC.3